MIEVGTLSPAVQAGAPHRGGPPRGDDPYVGYGFVEQVVGNRLIERIKSS